MRRATVILATLALCACAKQQALTPDVPLPPQVVTTERPVLQVVEQRVYVPIDAKYTSQIPHQEMDLWQCPLERDLLRAKLKTANGDRAAVRAIEGAPVKGTGK